MTTTANKSTTVTLSPISADPDQIKGYVFGQLVKLAQPHIEHYYSDLWLDAQWIGKHLPAGTEPGTFEFFYAVNDTGTHIGTNGGLNTYRRNKYRLTYECRRNQRWDYLEHYLHIEDLTT